MKTKAAWIITTVFSAMAAAAPADSSVEFGRVRVDGSDLARSKLKATKTVTKAKKTARNQQSFQEDLLFMECDMSMSMATPSSKQPSEIPHSSPPTPQTLPPSPPSPSSPTFSPSSPTPSTVPPQTTPPTVPPQTKPPTVPSQTTPPTVPPQTTPPTVPPQTTPPNEQVPTGSPSLNGSPSPTRTPSPTFQPLDNDNPTPSPTTPTILDPTVVPTTAPTVAPTISFSPSVSPSMNPTPTLFQADAIFECTPTGVDLAEPPFRTAIAVSFELEYLVESASPLPDFQQDLEEQILESALVGSLQCISGGPLFGDGGGENVTFIFGDGGGDNGTFISMNTSVTSSLCFAEVEIQNDCIVLKTTFLVVLGEEVDPEVAQVLGYAALQTDMSSAVFLDALPAVDRIEYLSPVQPIPPAAAPIEEDPTDGDEPSASTLSVTPWTLGAVVAMCIGGVIALWVWTRNRRTRNRNHQILMDESSLMSPDPISQA